MTVTIWKLLIPIEILLWQTLSCEDGVCARCSQNVVAKTILLIECGVLVIGEWLDICISRNENCSEKLIPRNNFTCCNVISGNTLHQKCRNVFGKTHHNSWNSRHEKVHVCFRNTNIGAFAFLGMCMKEVQIQCQEWKMCSLQHVWKIVGWEVQIHF